MLFFRKLSGITAPVISGQHTRVKGGSSASHSQQVSSVRGPKVQASTPPVFMLFTYLSQCCRALLPVKLHYSSSSQISATSAWAADEDIIRPGASFLKSGWSCLYRLSASNGKLFSIVASLSTDDYALLCHEVPAIAVQHDLASKPADKCPWTSSSPSARTVFPGFCG